MHRTLAVLPALAGTLLIASISLAQTAPAANPNAPSNPAVASPSDVNKPGAPAPGANSFTEDQARSRLESQGYAAVTGLVKDADGLWRGKASKGGQSQDVTVDYQGNIVAR